MKTTTTETSIPEEKTTSTRIQAALTRSGYTGKAILLTPAQVGLFFRFLGEP